MVEVKRPWVPEPDPDRLNAKGRALVTVLTGNLPMEPYALILEYVLRDPENVYQERVTRW